MTRLHMQEFPVETNLDHRMSNFQTQQHVNYMEQSTLFQLFSNSFRGFIWLIEFNTR